VQQKLERQQLQLHQERATHVSARQGPAVAAVAARCRRNGRRAGKLGFERQQRMWLLVASAVDGLKEATTSTSSSTASGGGCGMGGSGHGVGGGGFVVGRGSVAGGIGGPLRPWAQSCAGQALVS
jgi:hypothetical protein